MLNQSLARLSAVQQHKGPGSSEASFQEMPTHMFTLNHGLISCAMRTKPLLQQYHESSPHVQGDKNCHWNDSEVGSTHALLRSVFQQGKWVGSQSREISISNWEGLEDLEEFLLSIIAADLLASCAFIVLLAVVLYHQGYYFPTVSNLRNSWVGLWWVMVGIAGVNSISDVSGFPSNRAY